MNIRPKGLPGPDSSTATAAVVVKPEAKLTINLSARKQLMHPYQAYLHLHKDRVMSVVNDEWDYYQKVCDDAEKMSMMAFRTMVCISLLGEESDAVKEDVERYRLEAAQQSTDESQDGEELAAKKEQ